MWETAHLVIQVAGWIGVPMTVVALVRIAMKIVKASKAVKPIVAAAMVGLMK